MKKLLWFALAAVVLLAPCAFAQGLGTTAPPSTVQVNVAAESALTIQTSALVLSSPTNFADYIGTTSFTYFVRTTKSGGTGSITLQVTTDFSNGSGNTPSVAHPPTSTDALTYVATVSSPGTAATGSQTASTTVAPPVGSFGQDAHSVKAGNSASVAWTLSNDPLYPTGSYTATVTWTIAAT
jgi:hypothetical protein